MISYLNGVGLTNASVARSHATDDESLQVSLFLSSEGSSNHVENHDKDIFVFINNINKMTDIIT